MGRDPRRRDAVLTGAGHPAYLRRAGTGRLADGRRLTWTVAGGRGGRRWRSQTLAADGRLLEGLLLEVAPDGLPARLELVTRTGLLTLHPEADRAVLHGNVASPAGMRHVSLPWSALHALLVARSPVAAAVTASGPAARCGVGEGCSIPGILVDGDLGVRPVTLRVARTGERRWRILPADSGDTILVELDADGLPTGAADAETWPLEVEAPG